jgi:carboxymethylenebutenolidase
MCHPDTENGIAAGANAAAREGTFTLAVDGADMPVFQASPADQSVGNIIIIHDIHGANDFYHDLARRFAHAGYTAYLPDLFFREGPLPEPTHEAARERGGRISFPQAIDDLSQLIDAVQARSGIGIGTIGFCMGGTLVMLLAAREPRVSAGVIFYGFPANPNPTENRPVAPIAEAAQVKTPLLGFWGDQDKGVGMDNVERYRAALEQDGKDFAFTIYPGLPHGFLTFDSENPSYTGSQDAWEKTLAFYRERLR